MEDKTLEMTMLLDFFGELLTPKQRTCLELYYNEDLSLGEIGENLGISRQGVRDNLVRAENTLRQYEEKTGLVRRFVDLRKTQAKLLREADELTALLPEGAARQKALALRQEIERLNG